jgi:hypothetical protein
MTDTVVVIQDDADLIEISDADTVVVSETGAATTAVFSGIGTVGLVGDPGSGTATRVLRSDGTWGAQAGGGGGGAVDSVNGYTGTVVLDPDDLDDSATTNKFTSSAEISKLAGVEASATADQSNAEIAAAVEAATDSNTFTDTDHTKLDGIATGANAYVHPNHTGNVTSVGDGALTIGAGQVTNAMLGNTTQDTVKGRILTGSGPVTNLTAANIRTIINVEDGSTADQSNAEIKTAYELNADTNEFSDAEQTKLSGIETSATADQTDAEIAAAVEAATDSNTFTDTDHTKLDGIAASANNYSHPNHTGDVTSTGDGATVIAAEAVTLAKMAHIATDTLLGRTTAATGDVEVLTPAQAKAVLTIVVGDVTIDAQLDMGAHSVHFDESAITSSSGTATAVWTNSNKAKLTLSENVTTFNFTAPGGPCNLTLRIIQDTTARTISWPAAVLWPGGTPPTLSAGSGDIDLVSMYYDGTSYYAGHLKDFS